LPFGENGGLAQKGGAELYISGEWSANLKEMINKCLQKKTWDRPTAKFIVEEAKRHLHDGPVTITKHVRRKFPVFVALAGILVFGLCAGFFAGSYLNKPASDPKLHECIRLIEQADAVFDENDLTTWRETLTKYREAQELTGQHSLQLPNMEHRIRLLRNKMDDAISQSIENAKNAFTVRSEMALFALKDALEIDPDHEEAKALYEKYIQVFPRRE
jgi:hypothetical protein